MFVFKCSFRNYLTCVFFYFCCLFCFFICLTLFLFSSYLHVMFMFNFNYVLFLISSFNFVCCFSIGFEANLFWSRPKLFRVHFRPNLSLFLAHNAGPHQHLCLVLPNRPFGLSFLPRGCMWVPAESQLHSTSPWNATSTHVA